MEGVTVYRNPLKQYYEDDHISRSHCHTVCHCFLQYHSHQAKRYGHTGPTAHYRLDEYGFG
jgi:hypothetical protein